jgi:hypothetical protein
VLRSLAQQKYKATPKENRLRSKMSVPRKLGEMAVVQSAKAVLDHFGLWPIIAGIFIASASSLWTWAERQPLSVIVLTSASAGIAAIYAVLLPGVVRLLMAGKIYPKINPIPWRNATSLRLYQMACILAGIEPKTPVPAPARGWLQTLITGAADGKFSIQDGMISSTCSVTSAELRKFVESIGERWPL